MAKKPTKKAAKKATRSKLGPMSNALRKELGLPPLTRKRITSAEFEKLTGTKATRNPSGGMNYVKVKKKAKKAKKP